MNKKAFNTPAITIVIVILAVFILATTNLSQTRRPPLKGGVSQNEQQGDVFNSNSDPYRNPRPCKPDDCPCQSAQAVAFEEWDCAQQLADWDNHITKRMADIREINAYPQMRNKKKLDAAKDPDILLYLRRKEETQQSCDCLKKYYQQICSLSSWDEFVRLHPECGDRPGPPYRPYPSEEVTTDAVGRRRPGGRPGNPPASPCNFNSPPVPPTLPPHDLTVCDLRELASLVHERYGTGEPIRLIKVKSTPNTYLLLLSGMEGPWLGNAQATSLEESAEEAAQQVSFYRRWVLYALQQASKRGDLPPGADIIIAGHSLGGMIAHNLLADGTLSGALNVRVPKIVTFGSPITSPRIDGTSYLYVEHDEDRVLSLPIWNRFRLGGRFKTVNIKGGLGFPDLWGYHDAYHINEELKRRNLSGDPAGQRGSECMRLDLDLSFSFTVPSMNAAKNKVSEAIGEIGMEQEAKRLGYGPLVPPSKASNRPQGYDGIYWDYKTGAIVIGEAKGGGATLGTGYGYRQGTVEWAKAAANAIVKSRTANSLEERYALLILCALDESEADMAKGKYQLSFCESLQPCKPPVRIELFQTDYGRNGLPGPTTHKVLAKYP
jgi:hypothetical protein